MPNLLFLCTGNACRSQMGEAWTKALYGDQFTVYSAGVQPHGVDPKAVQVMAEVGISMAEHTSKHLHDLAHIAFDVVITVCDHAAEACPPLPKTTFHLHHTFPDPPKLAAGLPDEEALNCYRHVRDEIQYFVQDLPNTLSRTSPTH